MGIGEFTTALLVAFGFLVIVIAIFVLLMRSSGSAEKAHRVAWNAMGMQLGLRPSNMLPSTVAEGAQLFAALSNAPPIVDSLRGPILFGARSGHFVAVFVRSIGHRDELALIISSPSDRHRGQVTTEWFTACRVYLHPAPLGIGLDVRSSEMPEPLATEIAARYAPIAVGDAGFDARFRVRAYDGSRAQRLLRFAGPTLVAIPTGRVMLNDEMIEVVLAGRVTDAGAIAATIDAAVGIARVVINAAQS